MSAHLYWGINCYTNAGGNTYFQLAEVSMASSIGGANLCVGGTAGANNYAPGQPPSNAVDGNPSTFWSGNSSPQSFWWYQFASAVQIEEIKITSRSDIPTNTPLSWSVRYSDDGVTWFDTTYFTALTWTAAETQTFDSNFESISKSVSHVAFTPTSQRLSKVAAYANFVPIAQQISKVVAYVTFTPSNKSPVVLWLT